MTISELIKKLQEIEKGHGDLPVRVLTLTHLISPELYIKEASIGKIVLLGP